MTQSLPREIRFFDVWSGANFRYFLSVSFYQLSDFHESNIYTIWNSPSNSRLKFSIDFIYNISPWQSWDNNEDLCFQRNHFERIPQKFTYYLSSVAEPNDSECEKCNEGSKFFVRCAGTWITFIVPLWSSTRWWMHKYHF